MTSRRARSYWTRVATAAISVGLLGFTVWLGNVGMRWSSAQVFQLLGWYAFVYCLFAGALLTADALSAEKRGNTLGLLFLTDLRSRDILLGKLLANSVGCLFGLLALLPVLAIPMMLGGVQFSEFCGVAASLGSTLLLSLAVGLFVSVQSVSPFRATTGAVLILFVLGLGIPLLSNASSVGWNERDEGGTSRGDADWIWKYSNPRW